MTATHQPVLEQDLAVLTFFGPGAVIASLTIGSGESMGMTLLVLGAAENRAP